MEYFQELIFYSHSCKGSLPLQKVWNCSVEDLIRRILRYNIVYIKNRSAKGHSGFSTAVSLFLFASAFNSKAKPF